MKSAQELLDEPQTPETPPLPRYETAFLVTINHDGTISATDDLSQPTVMRSATASDMRRACSEVVHDVNTAQTAAHAAAQVVNWFVEQAKAQEEAQVNSRIAAKLSDRGIVVPR